MFGRIFGVLGLISSLGLMACASSPREISYFRPGNPSDSKLGEPVNPPGGIRLDLPLQRIWPQFQACGEIYSTHLKDVTPFQVVFRFQKVSGIPSVEASMIPERRGSEVLLACLESVAWDALLKDRARVQGGGVRIVDFERVSHSVPAEPLTGYGDRPQYVSKEVFSARWNEKMPHIAQCIRRSVRQTGFSGVYKFGLNFTVFDDGTSSESEVVLGTPGAPSAAKCLSPIAQGMKYEPLRDDSRVFYKLPFEFYVGRYADCEKNPKMNCLPMDGETAWLKFQAASPSRQ